MSESDYETPDTGQQPAPPAPAAARQVSITLNNFSSSVLHLRGSSVSHGIFNPGPPETIYAGTSASWQAESAGFATGTEGYTWYVPEDGITEFELYWNNPAVGSNSYGSTMKNGNAEVWSISDAGTAGNASSVVYSVYEKVQQWSASSWMKGIEDSRSLGNLSIPGTHDSGATYSPDGDIIGVIIAQDQTITQQLNSGIRFLDIRCRVVNGVFTIHHDLVYQNINFGDVLNACVGFLSAHPSETILMRIKQEYSTASNAEFNAIFDNYHSSYSGYLYTGSQVPTLGEVRKKNVIISNVGGLPGIQWNSMVVQDNYNPSGGIAEKRDSISDNLSAAITDHSKGGDRLYLNFISKQGEPLVQTINQAASKLNPAFLTLLGEKKAPVAIGIGIIAMDFPNRTGGAIQVIINSNFRLVNENFYSLRQKKIPRVGTPSTVTINFTFTTDNRGAVPDSRLHFVAPPGTHIYAVSYQPPERLTISGDGKTADVYAPDDNTSWTADRSVVLAVHSDADVGKLLTGSIQYFTAEGVPGAQCELSVATLSHTLSLSQTYFKVMPGDTVQLEVSLEPTNVSPPAKTRVTLELPPHTTIADVIASDNFILASFPWGATTLTLQAWIEGVYFNALVLIKVENDAPMDVELPVYVTHIPVNGSAGDSDIVTLHTASEGFVEADSGTPAFLMDPGGTSTMTVGLITSDNPATPGSRIHITVPEYVRIVDMSHSDYEVLSIAADGRSADVIAVEGDGPWERNRTITATLSSDAPENYAGIGYLRFYGPTGLEASNYAYAFVLPAGNGE
ncbi:phosphatidylinositol-specific phospholipase C [Vagococcus sp. WN89Y]|uniref:phosphatidylinositol-specific phospholipase C n=1 Tax=Vagococcus sp. WN89Y TaxID=3457258 RepID=UPI003FCD8FB3